MAFNMSTGQGAGAQNYQLGGREGALRKLIKQRAKEITLTVPAARQDNAPMRALRSIKE